MARSDLKFADESPFWSPRFDKGEQHIDNADLVFVGYGVTRPNTSGTTTPASM